MRDLVVVAVLVASLAIPAALLAAQATAPTAGTSLGSVTLTTGVMADGRPLAAGTYQVRLTGDQPTPAVGQSPEAERYVEFVAAGKVVGRVLATVIPQSEMGQVAKGPRPRSGGSRVDLLKEKDYLRVWINRSGMNYLIHMPPATS